VFSKLTFAMLGVLCATVLPASGRLPRSARAWLTVAGSLLLFAALAGRNTREQLLGLPPRYEGLVALPVYFGCLVLGAKLLGPERARGSTAWFFGWLSFAAIAIGAVALLEAAGIEPLPGTGARAGSLLGNASDEGALAVLLIGPLASIAIAGRRRLHLTAAGAIAAALICSGSRGALVGLTVTAVTLAWQAPSRRRATVTLLLLVGVAAAVFAAPGFRDRVLGQSPLAARTVTGRRLLAEEAARLAADAPVLGVGPSGFLDRAPQVQSDRYQRIIGPENPPDSPHDWPLQTVLAGGFGLLIAALALVCLTVRYGRRGLAHQPTGGERAAFEGMLAGLFGYAVALLFHFTSPGTTPVAAVLAGALLASGELTPPTGAGRGKRAQQAVSCVTASALLGVLAFAAGAELPLRTAVLDAASGHTAAADAEFHDAASLRPWDPAVPELATHAFAALAAIETPGAARAGLPWSEKALTRDPYSVPTLEDASVLAAAQGERSRARALLRRARVLEPRDLSLAVREHELLP
jgi:hypothetical protein